MKRLLVFAAFAVPAALAFAAISTAPSGVVVDLDNYSARYQTSYINAAQCAGAQLNLEWDVVDFNGGLAGSGNYQIYASSVQSSATGDANFCPEVTNENVSPPELVGLVTSVAYATDLQRLTVSGSAAVTAARQTPCAEGKVLYICAHLKDASSSAKGYARGKFMVQINPPNAPTNVQAGPARVDSLMVTWAESAGGVEVDHYVAVATCNGETFRSGSVPAGTNETTISGLPVSDPPTSCNVVVHAYSLGGNESPASAGDEGTPMAVNDFWDTYRLEGQDDGGCGAGGTGPLGLLALGLLALLRRRA
jgi:MYXO-CTERM domain-containing protein